MEYDPRLPEVIANPIPFLQWLQDNDPVHWSDPLGGWVLTRYDDVRKALTSDWLSADRLTPYLQSQSADRQDRMANLIRFLNTWLAFKDPPEHTRLRTLLNKIITPTLMRRLEAGIQTIVDHLIADLHKSEGQDIEFIASFANPLPASVIMNLLGVPLEDMPKLRDWSALVQPFIGAARNTEDKIDLGEQGMLALVEYFRAAIRQRKITPTDDVISHFIALCDEGDLTEDELIGSSILFLFAGHETTTNLIGNGLRALIANPDQMAALRANPALIDSAVEEMLRYDGPTGALVRLIKHEVTLEGKSLKVGDRVFLMINAANHDPRKFADPESFLITREANQHMAFNHGAHFCLGAPLARAEARIALSTLLKNFSKIELAGPPIEYMDTLVMRGVRHMWVRLKS